MSLLPVASLVKAVQDGSTEPGEILTAYGKQALRAHAETNCLTEIMILSAETWAKECNRKGPLAGIPVSLKDTTGVASWDSTIGYSAWVGKPMQKDSCLVRLLRDAGAVPYVKTNVPITLMSGESFNDVFGRSTNPHSKAYTPGGSSGGEGALLAFGGSRIGIGTDVGGSVRIPAHFSGVMPWTPYSGLGRTRWGVIWDDGVVAPSPACKRALETVVEALRKDPNNEIINITPPSPYEGLKIASQLLIADGCTHVSQFTLTFSTNHIILAVRTGMHPVRTGESNDPGVAQALSMLALPSFLRRLYVWYLRYLKRDEIYAGLVEGWSAKSVYEYWPLVAQREDYRRRWWEMWRQEELDYVLTVPNSMPALPHGGMRDGFKALGYTLLFNLLDYTAGVLPVTHLDAVEDKLSSKIIARNSIEKAVYKMYDPNAMNGLPVGVQVVGKRLEEEKVLFGMQTIERLLKDEGKVYELLNGKR
ncbi:hypothetical protein DXG03_002394 [Asterophora parasitica]|uniref:amidase n=1 Tax=Asterophora parasitica TaxID=117018 RepID=A0A9P7G9V3_9AGAR|nr:hypothetical protein DXG03_002394 [Asterophora parasitica]